MVVSDADQSDIFVTIEFYLFKAHRLRSSISLGGQNAPKSLSWMSTVLSCASLEVANSLLLKLSFSITPLLHVAFDDISVREI